MIGEYVMTEADCSGTRKAEDSVGLGSYGIDSHIVQRYVTAQGWAYNEGGLGGRVPQPYAISYRALVPQREQCGNLLVPVCCSASHVAYGSIRMEPVYMILGQSAGTAAVLALEGGVAVQDVALKPGGPAFPQTDNASCGLCRRVPGTSQRQAKRTGALSKHLPILSPAENPDLQQW